MNGVNLLKQCAWLWNECACACVFWGDWGVGGGGVGGVGLRQHVGQLKLPQVNNPK